MIRSNLRVHPQSTCGGQNVCMMERERTLLGEGGRDFKNWEWGGEEHYRKKWFYFGHRRLLLKNKGQVLWGSSLSGRCPGICSQGRGMIVFLKVWNQVFRKRKRRKTVERPSLNKTLLGPIKFKFCTRNGDIVRLRWYVVGVQCGKREVSHFGS